MDVFSELLSMARQANPADILTVITAPDGQADWVGQMLIVPQDNEPEQHLIDSDFTHQLVHHIHTAGWQQPTLFEVDYHGKYQLFWDRLTVSASALVLGAGHISQPLVDLLTMVDYAVTVVDDRPDFANVARFPTAQKVVCKNFNNALAEFNLAGYSAVIIVTRGHRYDIECLRAVINCPIPYIGMIGSQRRVRAIIDMLAEEGVAAEVLARLKSPIGLDIGAQTPAEIAVSIVAEVIAVNRGANCLPLSAKRR